MARSNHAAEAARFAQAVTALKGIGADLSMHEYKRSIHSSYPFLTRAYEEAFGHPYVSHSKKGKGSKGVHLPPKALKRSHARSTNGVPPYLMTKITELKALLAETGFTDLYVSVENGVGAVRLTRKEVISIA